MFHETTFIVYLELRSLSRTFLKFFFTISLSRGDFYMVTSQVFYVNKKRAKTSLFFVPSIFLYYMPPNRSITRRVIAAISARVIVSFAARFPFSRPTTILLSTAQVIASCAQGDTPSRGLASTVSIRPSLT